MEFIPENEPRKDEEIAFIEDARAKDGYAGHSTERSIEELKDLVRQAMGKLGGSVLRIQLGRFKGAENERYGYMIYFNYFGKPGRIRVVGLPSRTGHANWVRQAKKYALYTVWKRFESLYNYRKQFPGDMPLIQYTLGWGDDQRTLVERVREEGHLPRLMAPDDAVEGKFEEID